LADFPSIFRRDIFFVCKVPASLFGPFYPTSVSVDVAKIAFKGIVLSENNLVIKVFNRLSCDLIEISQCLLVHGKYA
jgi:hypothetical protein